MNEQARIYVSVLFKHIYTFLSSCYYIAYIDIFVIVLF